MQNFVWNVVHNYKNQQKLKNWGYYNGAVDGIYGSKTLEAVKYFQRKNGLTVDGIAGDKTLAALGIRGTSNLSSSIMIFGTFPLT